MRGKILALWLFLFLFTGFIWGTTQWSLIPSFLSFKAELLNEGMIVYMIPDDNIFHVENCLKLGNARTGMPLRYAITNDYQPDFDCISKLAYEKFKKGFTPFPKIIFREIKEWSGKSTKNTETFQISSNSWRITWETWPGEHGEMNFQIYVHNENGDLIDVVANVIGNDIDNSVMRNPGRYYLKINTGQPYRIRVFEITIK